MRSRFSSNRITRRERLLYAPNTDRYFYEDMPTDHILYDRMNYVAPVLIVESVIARYKIKFKDGHVVFPFFRYWDQSDDRIKDVQDLRSVLVCEIKKNLRYGQYHQVGQFGNLFGDHLIQDLSPKKSVVGVMPRPVDALIMQCWFDHHLYSSSRFLDLLGGKENVLFVGLPITWSVDNLIRLKRKGCKVVLFPPIHKHNHYISNWKEKTKELPSFKVYNYPKLTEKARHGFNGWSISDFLFYRSGRIPTDLFE